MRGNPLGRYFDAVADVDWSLLQKLETGTGDTAALIMEEYELTRIDDGAYRGEMNLTVSGPIALRDELRSEPSAQAAAESWMGQRFAEADVAAGVVAPDIDEDVLKLIMQVDPGPVPAAIGDTWILPPGLVYGTPAVPEWPVPRQSVFYVERDVDCFWQIRIPAAGRLV